MPLKNKRKVKYCSQCGSDALIVKIPSDDVVERIICSNCYFIHYQNPNMIVGCLVVNNGKILLAKRAIEPRKGFWNLPAGFLENGETVEQGAAREVLEETGLIVETKEIISIYSILESQQVYILFMANVLAGKAQVTNESLEVEFFDIKNIPWSELAFSSTIFTLKHYVNSKNKNKIELAIGSHPSTTAQ